MVKSAVDELGPIDILVNNAGSLVERMKIDEVTGEKWDGILNLNLKSAVLCSQAVAASMMERRAGAIVNVVSIAGRNGGGPGAGAYSAAKAGLIAFTKSLARELGPYGIRVNAVSPGVIDTPFHEVFSTPEMMRTIQKRYYVPNNSILVVTGDVKADLHLRRVLGRTVYGEEIKANEAAKVIQLTRNLYADPWKLDFPLWNVGKSYCRPTSPTCPSCWRSRTASWSWTTASFCITSASCSLLQEPTKSSSW